MFDSKETANAARIVELIGERLDEYTWVGWFRRMALGAPWGHDVYGYRAEDAATGLTVVLRRCVGKRFTLGKIVDLAVSGRRNPGTSRNATWYELEITDPRRFFGASTKILRERIIFYTDEGKPEGLSATIMKMFSRLVDDHRGDDAALQESLEALFAHLHEIADFEYARRRGEKPSFEAIAAVL